MYSSFFRRQCVFRISSFANFLHDKGVRYNKRMRNWSTDTSRFKKNSQEHEIWQLEQLLNFGLGERETIDREKLEKYLPALAIDQDTRNFLEYVLYDKKPTHGASNRIS